MENYNFDDIRAYNDSDLKPALKRIMEAEGFHYILDIIYPGVSVDEIVESMKDINTINEFQKKYVIEYSNTIVDKTMRNFSFSGIENTDKNKAAIYVTNHRDIILDPAMLCQVLFFNGHQTTEIGIGSNLLIYPWIIDLVRVNKSFIVRRDLHGKEMLKGSMKLSEYIRHTILNKNSSIWLAQRQGRAKDGNDMTQLGVPKMLNFSGKSDLISNFKELNIIPVSISYQYEPCDKSKTYEMYINAMGGTYKKTFEDDLNSMGRGIYDYKGDVHFAFGKPLNEDLDKFREIKNKNEQYQSIVELIDKRIHQNYKLSSFNYIAHDILNNSDEYSDFYTNDEKIEFKEHTKKRLADIEADDKKILEEVFMGIYANPVKNKLKAEPTDYEVKYIQKRN